MTPGTQEAVIEGSAVLERIRSYWLSNSIHDLSGPSFAARGYLRLVLDEPNGGLTEPQRRYLTAALENIGRLVSLTQELNKFPGKDSFQFELVSFRALLEQAVAEVRPALLERNAQITADMAGGSLSTIGDREKLAFAVRTFVSSSVEFSGCGGSVQVQSREEDDKIVVRVSATRDPASPLDKPPPDLSVAWGILRLHGGSGSASRTSDGRYLVECELPVIRLLVC
jgi:signal transduction histidine kinase